MLCLLLAGGQVSAWFEAEHEGRQLSGREGFAKKFVPDDLYKSWYRDSIAKHVEQVKNLEQVKNSDRLAAEKAKQDETDKQARAEADRQAKEKADRQTLEQRNTLLKRTLTDYANGDLKPFAKDDTVYNHIEQLKTLTVDSYIKQLKTLMVKVGTLVDPNFKPYRAENPTLMSQETLFENIRKDMLLHIFDYQASFNLARIQIGREKLHDNDISLTGKVLFLKSVIPDITYLPETEQEYLASLVTRTMNKG